MGINVSFQVTLGLDQDLKLSPAALLVHTRGEEKDRGPCRSDSTIPHPWLSSSLQLRATGQSGGSEMAGHKKSGLEPQSRHILSTQDQGGLGEAKSIQVRQNERAGPQCLEP